MRATPLFLVLLLALTGCGDDEPKPDYAAEIPAPPELTEEEKRELLQAEAIRNRPPPVPLKRERDGATGISLAFPNTWRVDRGPLFVYQGWASAQGPLDPEGKYVTNVTVTSFEAAGRTLDEHLQTMRTSAAEANPGLEEVVAGGRLVGPDEARLFRYTVPWQEGRIVEEATILKRGDQFCVIVGSCHKDERGAFTRTYALILASFQWRRPAPPK